eukprot:CAMPEP_0172322592 /NCGR_PEP_ID=MMETSP1058-20130122/46326_1 /TAXON_ID=83371 /ORGANISM="Detonula confervacea, Strain CCMP 353" /LENGTH=382 /DNA_ID=CAMNT_0013038371 /DNA_START=159 /DNA_END=1304 /DNA_ORIENTATION=-
MPSDDCSSAPYRPRYSVEESSDAAYEKDLRHRHCMGRKRRVVTIMLLVAFICVAGMVTRGYLLFAGIKGDGQTTIKANREMSLWGYKKKISKSDQAFGRAQSDSYDFFNAIPDEEWKEMKHKTMTMIDLQDGIIGRTSYLLSESGANVNSNSWWIDNWKINFTCQNKVLIGGKWLCDPTRIISIADENAKNTVPKPRGRGRKKREDSQKECLVYISGEREIEFGHHFLDYSLARMIELHSDQVGENLLSCEVHIFAPSGQEMLESRDGLFIHPWGFRPSNKESMGLAADNTAPVAFKTLQETIAELKHSGRISVLVLDCEGCEWDIYGDILSLEEPIQQVLMQMHGLPYMANELFWAMQEAGYVIFNREASVGNGEVYDYSW